jgi:hypothetical protein
MHTWIKCLVVLKPWLNIMSHKINMTKQKKG